MKRIWLGIGAAILLLIAAYFLRDAIYQTVVLPLAYLLWLARFYYSAVPQVILWGLLLVILFMIIFSNLVPVSSSKPREVQKHGLEKGQIETLTGWLIKADKGTYFKWQIANRLGHIGLGLRETSERHGNFQSATEAVERYLEAGLNTSFVDYPNRKSAPTPLDLNPKEVVDYLEEQMVGKGPTTLESNRGRHS